MKGLLLLIITSVILPVHAGIAIYGTRIIYPAEKKEVVVQLMNQGPRASLVQAWIDDGDTALAPEHIQVPFMLTPPVAKVAGNSGQQLKIKKMANALPGDKESLFFLNVLDIPPNNPESSGTNVLKFAMQNRIKLFYRPAGIAPVSQNSFKKLSLVHNNSRLAVNNDTANWITLTDIKANGVKVNQDSVMIAPLSRQAVNINNHNAKQYNLTLIDDHGNYLSENVSVK